MLIGPPDNYVGPQHTVDVSDLWIAVPSAGSGVQHVRQPLPFHVPMRAMSVVGYAQQSHQGRTDRLLGRLEAVQLERLQAGCACQVQRHL